MAQWRKVTMREAVRFIRDGGGVPTDGMPVWAASISIPYGERGPACVEWFDDGTAVACASDWTGPYSEVTPDVDARPPEWWIYC